MDHALDIRNLVESQEDLVLFIRKFLGKEKYWLFKRQRARLLSLERDPVGCYRDKDREGTELLDWKPTDSVDK